MKDQLTRRGTAAAYPEPLRNAPNAALLIDFDNVTMGIRSDLQVRLRNLLDSDLFKGKISVQRAYADWRRYPQYIVPLSEASIDLIFAPAFGSNKKNATDIRLAIDALELVFTRPEIGTYILLSGDSDFSSLVLKLKEYGKYVIGVGIRESSSDLLIQNCDEYFSYSELTGLLREGEVEHRRRDPWELIVEATVRMKQQDDVMRSDRLKQVMQELDPNFDEKNAGFSKYSKFLHEAGRRGLLRLSKMDNGQFEIELGENANVPLDMEPTKKPVSSKAASEPRGRRRRGESTKEKPAEQDSGRGRPAQGLALAEAFDLMRRALTTLGAVGEESTDSEQVREQMVELAEDGDDPIFDGSRFQRLLRQAHDAGVIDLAKQDDVYLLKLRQPPDQDDVPSLSDEGDASRRGDARAKSARTARSRRRGARKGRADAAAEQAEAPADGGEAPVRAEETPGTAPHADKPTRNPRFRRGSRRGGSAGKSSGPQPVPGPVEPQAPVPEVTEPKETGARVGVRGRRGGRSRPAASKDAAPKDGFVPGPAGGGEPREAQRPPEPERRVAAAPPPDPDPAPPPADDVQAGGSLFKRMSAALQRALGPDQVRDREDGS